MKLCYLGWGNHIHLERWAGYFARAGHEVSVISVAGKGNYPSNVRQYSLDDVPISYRLRFVYLGFLLWRLRPDIVHVHWAPFATFLPRRWSGPLVITAWGSDIYRINELTVNPQELVQVFRRAQVITCDSRDLARTIETTAHLAAGHVKVIQWGVDTCKFKVANGPTALARKLDIAGRPVALSPRSFAPVYNLQTILKAFRLVVNEIPTAILLMKYYNMEESYMRGIQDQIRVLGLSDSVHIIERMSYDEIPDFYRTGEVLISIPHVDSTPVSMLEGMACGCIPVVSDLPSIREWVREGWNGFLVAVDDPNAVARAIIKVLKNNKLVRKWAKRNVDLISKEGDQRANMQRMEHLYKDVVKHQAAVSQASSQERGQNAKI